MIFRRRLVPDTSPGLQTPTIRLRMVLSTTGGRIARLFGVQRRFQLEIIGSLTFLGATDAAMKYSTYR